MRFAHITTNLAIPFFGPFPFKSEFLTGASEKKKKLRLFVFLFLLVTASERRCPAQDVALGRVAPLVKENDDSGSSELS